MNHPNKLLHKNEMDVSMLQSRFTLFTDSLDILVALEVWLIDSLQTQRLGLTVFDQNMGWNDP